MGLARHEEFAEYFDIDSAELAVGIPHCLVASVVYRCDLKTQYTALPTVHKRPYTPWYLGVQHPGPAPALMDGDVGGADGESSAPAEPRVHGEGQIERSSDEHLRNMLGFHAWAHLTSAAGPEDFFSLTPSQALPVNTESLMLPLQNAVISGHREASRKLPLSLCDGPSGVVVEMDFGDDSGVPSNPTGLELAVALPGEESVNPRPESSASNASSCPHTRPVIFRVVSGTVGHKKLARTDSALELSGIT